MLCWGVCRDLTRGVPRCATTEGVGGSGDGVVAAVVVVVVVVVIASCGGDGVVAVTEVVVMLGVKGHWRSNILLL